MTTASALVAAVALLGTTAAALLGKRRVEDVERAIEVVAGEEEDG